MIGHEDTCTWTGMESNGGLLSALGDGLNVSVKGEGRIQDDFPTPFLTLSTFREGVNNGLLGWLNREGKSSPVWHLTVFHDNSLGLGYHKGSTYTDV